MTFVVGCDFEEFRHYYNDAIGKLGKDEGYWIEVDPSHLVVWRENGEIVGHAIWHESNTKEHKEGDPRDEQDRRMLERLLGGEGDFVELHEVWLREDRRGKGYGERFFEFFEDFMEKRGHDSAVYYAYHPAAVAICRKRGYSEVSGLEARGLEGRMETMYIFHISPRGSPD
ncbi:MAG: GNAT family N-acetyltransferase [Candidatus Geothermarchaeales archaeon]